MDGACAVREQQNIDGDADRDSKGASASVEERGFLRFRRPKPSAHRHRFYADNYGYTLWAESIRKPVLRILAKYGIN